MDFQSYQKRLSSIKRVLEDWRSSIEEEQELLNEKDGIEDRLKIDNDQGRDEEDRRTYQTDKRRWEVQRNRLPNSRQITEELKALCEPFTIAHNLGRVTLDEDLNHFYNEEDFRLTDAYNSEDLPRRERLAQIEVALELVNSLYEASHRFSPVFGLPASGEGAKE